MLNENLVYLASILTVGANIRYAYLTYRGQVVPSLITWSLWIVIPLVMFFAQISDGITIQSLLPLFVGVSPIMVIICAFIKRKFTFDFTKVDITCAAIAGLAIVLWIITGEGDVAIILSIIAGFTAAIPTIIHSYNAPNEENTAPFVIGVVSAAITLFTIDKLEFSAVAFPSYLLVSNFIITATIYSSRKFKSNKPKFKLKAS